MKKYSIRRILLFAVFFSALVIGSSWLVGFGSHTIDFSTEVKPVINAKCISCHGGVKAKGGFSLLFREEALAKTESGLPAIIPGDADNSELIRRISHKDPEERMPYGHEPLTKEEISIFTKWIDQGAQWGQHWAYKPLQPVEVPRPKSFFGLIDAESAWAKNEVDYFIEEKLKEHGLQPSPQADKATLLRRVSLDIIGMPAPEHIAKQFLSDSSEKAYANLVDSLLASGHYGEKWTSMWLDIARYADTKGYEADIGRTIWRYRDWLIDAFNKDMPYDSFLVRQIAGDLLPDPADEDYIATAFHRNTMTNDEGGTDNEEFRVSAVMDRVNTTWTATMGTTFSCVQCHSHPYDPFKHEEYYKFMAFFNNARDEDTQADYPLLRTYNAEDSTALVRLKNWLAKNVSEQKAAAYYTFLKTWQPTINSLQCDKFINAAEVSSWYAGLQDNGSCRLADVSLDDADQFMFRYTASKKDGVVTIHIDSLNGPVLLTVKLEPTNNNWLIKTAGINAPAGRHDLYFRYKNPHLSNTEETGVLFEWFVFAEQFPGKEKPGYDSAYKWYWQLMNADVKTTPVMFENPSYMQRATHIFERGNWLVKGDEMKPGVPASLHAFPQGAPQNRLGLAAWLVAKQNPLTARTMVNRVWEQVFGNGLAETVEDLGTQGIAPTHAALLDWLSYTYMHDYNWSTRQLIRTIVMSAAYRQSSVLTPALQDKDPANRLYARAPRVRLSAEQVRDQALSVAGVISTKMYGPGVYPYQPEGIWLSPWNGATWEQSKGEDQYRRALYTYWKRSAAYPSMITFDGVSREVCTVRRIRTNTPLQALTTLNDEAFVDIARQFALRMQKEAGTDKIQQIKRGYMLATNKTISDKSLSALVRLYDTAFKQFNADADKTCAMLGGMNSQTNASNASLTVVANALLNLDEVVTKN